MTITIKDKQKAVEQWAGTQPTPIGAIPGYTTMYKPDFLFWESTGITSPFRQTAVIRVGNKLYAFGGVDAASTATNKIYSASWSENPTFSDTGATLPATVAGARTAVIDEKIFIFGSCNGDTQIYSASLSNPLVWGDSGATIDQVRANAPFVVTNDKIFIIKGYNGSSGLSSILSASISNPTSWTIADATGQGGVGWETAACAVGDRIMFGGGIEGVGNFTAIVTCTTNATGTLRFYYPGGISGPGNFAMPTFFHDGDNIFYWGGTNGSALAWIYVSNIRDGYGGTQWNLVHSLPITTNYNWYSNWVGPDGRYYFIHGGTNTSNHRTIYRSGRKAINVLNEVSSSYPAYAGLPGVFEDGTPGYISSQVRIGFDSWRTNRTGSF